MQRGDLVVVALQGEHGKPRPALVVQSDLFTPLSTVTVLPLTSQHIDGPARVTITPSTANGLQAASRKSWCTGRKPSPAARSAG